MIQDIFPKHLQNEYIPDLLPDSKDILLSFQGSKILACIDNTQQVIFPKISQSEACENFKYLFSIDNEKYFLAQENAITITGFEYIEVRELRKNSLRPKEKLFAAYTGKHLSDWYHDNKFCGRCGNPMKHSAKERAMTCCQCNYTSYPRIMPAVIVGVTNGDKILLTKYRKGYDNYALVAGFTEIGETAEQTVAREVMEEAGVKVKNIHYYKSQPWGIANDLLLGYFCEVDGDTKIRMDENELKFADWVAREDVVLQPDSFSLTNEMMKLFKDGKNSQSN